VAPTLGAAVALSRPPLESVAAAGAVESPAWRGSATHAHSATARTIGIRNAMLKLLY
jgi:hypothetical protein